MVVYISLKHGYTFINEKWRINIPSSETWDTDDEGITLGVSLFHFYLNFEFLNSLKVDVTSSSCNSSMKGSNKTLVYVTAYGSYMLQKKGSYMLQKKF